MPRILMIEDDTDINNSTAQYLRRQGCECVQAFSGTEGRLLWQAGGMDLLLVDLMLPGLSGGELIAEIRRSLYCLPRRSFPTRWSCLAWERTTT